MNNTPNNDRKRVKLGNPKDWDDLDWAAFWVVLMLVTVQVVTWPLRQVVRLINRAARR